MRVQLPWQVAICAMFFVLLGVVGCRQLLPENSYLKRRSVERTRWSTRDARDRFDHGVHRRALDQAEIRCVDCHSFALRIATDDEELAKTLSAYAQHPGSAACHPCHLPGEDKMLAAPRRCNACHRNLWPLLPEDHAAGWQTAHAAASHAENERCQDCHHEQECVDCHARRDSIETRVHERGFRFFHSIEAWANPMSCSSCHRADFCIQCHRQNGIGSAG